MATEKKEKKSDRQARWEAELLAQKENNPSVYDTRGGDAQLSSIPESFK